MDKTNSAGPCTISSGTAITYLDELGDFALSRQSSELVELINKVRTTLEKLFGNVDRLKETQLSDSFDSNSIL